MSEPVLRLTGIEKTYNRGRPNAVTVLGGASLSIAPGETVALVAPSGAGKSTLLHIAGLLDTADAGVVSILGTSLGQASDRQRTQVRRNQVGFVYQFHHLLPEFSALENIVLPQQTTGRGRGEARSRAEALLEQVGLSDRADHRPGALSGGEQQRVAFCRALANAPALLLADEPTGNLDPETSDRVFDMLTAMVRDSGMSALIATHNPDLAARLDRTVSLVGGVIVPGQARAT